MQLRRTVLLALCALSLNALGHHEGETHWSYTGDDGPAHWGDLSPAFAACRDGKNQSPVDLDSAMAKRDNSVEISHPPLNYSVENNGQTIQATAREEVKGLKLGGQDYVFKQFHFHKPSEHTFNQKHFPTEGHFVHQNERGELAVLAVMFDEGEENPALKQLLAQPLKVGEKAELAEKLDIGPLFPKERGHFRVNGSMTTPPCGEGVHWIVFKTPVAASKEQLATIQAIGTANNRPVQPLNARIVVEE